MVLRLSKRSVELYNYVTMLQRKRGSNELKKL